MTSKYFSRNTSASFLCKFRRKLMFIDKSIIQLNYKSLVSSSVRRNTSASFLCKFRRKLMFIDKSIIQLNYKSLVSSSVRVVTSHAGASGLVLGVGDVVVDVSGDGSGGVDSGVPVARFSSSKLNCVAHNTTGNDITSNIATSSHLNSHNTISITDNRHTDVPDSNNSTIYYSEAKPIIPTNIQANFALCKLCNVPLITNALGKI
ncbi:Hypothetical predicted protein [Octopus vulgaris]|uniref:Uncharacterized protein n=1 Tax=Octopus vulgaris TaxID=6645 RepID=A0AA36F1L8_OCTVU|nr:Hypothetical predicted protein [Octopus vulgaris]